MPWPEVCPMDARMKFVAAVPAGEDSAQKARQEICSIKREADEMILRGATVSDVKPYRWRPR